MIKLTSFKTSVNLSYLTNYLPVPFTTHWANPRIKVKKCCDILKARSFINVKCHIRSSFFLLKINYLTSSCSSSTLFMFSRNWMNAWDRSSSWTNNKANLKYNKNIRFVNKSRSWVRILMDLESTLSSFFFLKPSGLS